MTLEEVNVLINAQLAPYKKAMDEMKRVTENSTKSVKDNMKSVNNTIKSQTSGIKNVLSSLAKIATFGILAKKMYDFGKYSVQTALEVSASMNQIKRLMGESTQSFLKWSKSGALAYNMATADALKYGAVYSNLFSNFIKDEDQLAGYTVKMLKTSAVVASATGRTMDDVMNRIRSGMLGSTEAIEDLGINVNVSMIKSTKAFQEMANGRSWEQLDFNTQQAIRMMAILEQASTKFGDTIMQGPTTSIAYFTALLKNAALNIGNAILPAISAVMPVLNGFASVLNTVTAKLATFMQLLFGKKASASGGMSDTAKSIGGMGKGLDDANKGAGKLGKGLGGAGKQAKALKKELLGLMGFDEINLLGKNKDDDSAGGSGGGGGGSGGGSSGGGAGGISLPRVSFEDSLSEEDTGPIERFIERLKELLQPTMEALERLGEALVPLKEFVAQGLIDFYNEFLVPVGLWTLGEGLPRFIDIISKTLNNIDFPKINGALKELWKALAPFTIKIGEGLLWFLDEVLSPLTSWVISDIVPEFIKGLAYAIDICNSAIDAVKPMIKWLFDNLLKPIAQWTGGVITEVLKVIVEALKKISDWCKEHKGLMEDMAIVIASFLGVWGAYNVGVSIWGVVSGLWAFVASGAAACVVGEVLAGVIAVLTSPVTLIIAAIGTLVAIGVLLYKHWDELCAWCGEVWDSICEAVSTAITTIGEFFSGLWDSIVEIFTPIGEWFTEVFKGAWDGIVSIFSGIGTWFADRWTDICNAFSDVATWFSNMFNRAWTFITDIFKSIGTWFSDRWNDIKTALSSVATWFNDMFKKAYTNVQNAFNSIGQWFSDKYNAIKNVFSSVASWFGDKFRAAWNAIKDAFSTVGSFFSGVWSTVTGIFKDAGVKIGNAVGGAFKSAVNGILATIERIVNGFIGMINGAIRLINKIPGVNLGKVSTISLPRLARGGIIDSPTIAMVGEAGKEAVVPLENTGFLQTMARIVGDSVSKAVGNCNNSGLSSSGDIIIQIGDTEFGRFAIAKINEEHERAGMTLLKI